MPLIMGSSQQDDGEGVDFVVAADGSGDFLAIQEAIDAAYGDATIVVEPGEYKEQVKLADPPSD